MEKEGAKCTQGGGGVLPTPLATSKVLYPHWDPRLVVIAISSRAFGRPKQSTSGSRLLGLASPKSLAGRVRSTPLLLVRLGWTTPIRIILYTLFKAWLQKVIKI